ncbi:sigma factor-like helix-turn-helix DNA-binding protein [Mycoplasma todarodis]|uniref:Uncharacterized protein n=1 Tax=Mycoplasma todarodis TaxID=1937191 RepID=A0A4R0XL88_9MOLU|nr:sigma factor-like helix-turn-helix DNA-binding protein [Mycoplasma todarodis]TCG11403.1 hypothetical protein C4B25_01760 [Mycoplasma todarodis]
MNKLEEREYYLELFDKYSAFLTQTQKQAIQLCWIEDLSLAEASEVVATTRSAIHDAINKGKKKLDKINKKMNGE